MKSHGFRITRKPRSLWGMGTGVRRGMRFIPRYYNTVKPFMRPAVCSPGMVDCKERKQQVHFHECLECGNFRVWHAKDDGLKRCYHEFKDLESRGFYDGTWDDHPENFDPETFESIQEQKRLNERLNREMELERAELDERAEELANDRSPEDYYGYEFYESDEEDDHEEDEPHDYDEEEW
jgi:hypothetical protein